MAIWGNYSCGNVWYAPTNIIQQLCVRGLALNICHRPHAMLIRPWSEGHIGVLISTIAFGMGIDCKQVNKIIHFRPSKNIECYVLESGHAGRDGSPGECILLYNGLLSTHCSRDMKELLHDETGCRRELLLKPFGFIPVPVSNKHTSCDNCSKTCNCDTTGCPISLGLTICRATDEAP
jgi:superfamily II DNA helicase RecQ